MFKALKHTVFWVLLIALAACGRQEKADEALFLELGQCIRKHTIYYAPGKSQPDSLRALLYDAMPDSARFEVYGWLLETYRTCDLDSQQYYAELRLPLAVTPFEKQVSLLNYSEILMRRGKYRDMLVYIDSALVQPLNPALAPYYYQTLYPVIEEAYMEQVQRRQYWIIALMVSVLVIAALLVGFLAYVNRKRRQLTVLNNRLALRNEELRQSNHIKTVYVGRYMKMTTLHDFDDAFLELFPDFVAQVRELLVPEAELHIKPKERLNTDLRVLALIHLGFTDSRQIAEFLRYSLSTIYNSRTRMRNLAKDDREHFEEKIAAL